MKNRDEKLERLIKDDYMRAAAEEENVLLKDDSVVPEGKKESIYEKISAEIAEMRKKEKQDLYANMSEEDRRGSGDWTEDSGGRGEKSARGV